ncbi:hypothetical protein Dimus_008322 [Dionaea muscipula]
MLNKNFANISLVAAANPSGTSQGAKSSEEQVTIEEQMQYLELPDQEEEAVNYVNPQSGASNPEPKGNHELPNTGSSTSRSPKKRKMKRSTSGRGIEVESESKKSSAPRATTEFNDPGTEMSRPELASTSGKGIIVATKVKDKDTPSQHIDLT